MAEDLNIWVRERLEAESEEGFRDFSAKLLPGVDNLMGVRIPKLRKMAKEISKKDWRNYLIYTIDDSFEETMMQGLVIGCAAMGLSERLSWIERFVPKIDNWSVCDSFCISLKSVREDLSGVWTFLEKYIASEQEYDIRFAVVMYLFHFVREDYLERIFERFEQARAEAYYAQMAIAWALATCYASYPEQTLKFLQKESLDVFTHNKALAKICESLTTAPGDKKRIRQWKRAEEAR